MYWFLYGLVRGVGSRAAAAAGAAGCARHRPHAAGFHQHQQRLALVVQPAQVTPLRVDRPSLCPCPSRGSSASAQARSSAGPRLLPGELLLPEENCSTSVQGRMRNTSDSEGPTQKYTGFILLVFCPDSGNPSTPCHHTHHTIKATASFQENATS